MKDIDFDELDKAVNSLMGTAAGPAIKDDSAPAPAEPKSDAPVAAPGPVPADPLTTPAPSPAPARPVMPAQRRSGRFMDMVHTSSDMTSSRPSQSPSREGLSVAPRTQPEAPTPTNPATEPTSASTDAPAWPDPLELASSQAPTEPVPTAETRRLASADRGLEAVDQFMQQSKFSLLMRAEFQQIDMVTNQEILVLAANGATRPYAGKPLGILGEEIRIPSHDRC